MSAQANKYPQVGLYSARLHAIKVFRELAKATGEDALALHLFGEQVKYRNDTDRELPYRQESNFYYLTGCDIPATQLICWCTKNKNPKEPDDDLSITSVLLIPEVDNDDVMWSGMPLTPEEVHKTFDGSRIATLAEYPGILKQLPTKIIHTLPGYPLPKESETEFTSSDKHLLMACQKARLTKTAVEIDLIQIANDISSKAHEGVMRALGSGDLNTEYEASAIFSYHCARKGAKALAYEVIAASGTSAGTLHYIKNKSSFPSTGNGSLLLLDAGCEFENYASDITRTFPIGNGGKFTPEAKDIYRLVEEMQDAAYTRIKPGASWDAIHLVMHQRVATGLLKLGIFKSPNTPGVREVAKGVKEKDFDEVQDDAREGRDHNKLLQDILDSGVTMAFFPHGLGHNLGLDVHDSPLLKESKSGESPLLKYLRYRGNLEEGMVITVEPGVYFNPFLLKPHKDSPYIDQKVLKKYMPVGGVRIEDDNLVTSNGFHNFTTVKRSIEDIEALCQSTSKPAALSK